MEAAAAGDECCPMVTRARHTLNTACGSERCVVCRLSAGKLPGRSVTVGQMRTMRSEATHHCLTGAATTRLTRMSLCQRGLCSTSQKPTLLRNFRAPCTATCVPSHLLSYEFRNCCHVNSPLLDVVVSQAACMFARCAWVRHSSQCIHYARWGETAYCVHNLSMRLRTRYTAAYTCAPVTVGFMHECVSSKGLLETHVMATMATILLEPLALSDPQLCLDAVVLKCKPFSSESLIPQACNGVPRPCHTVAGRDAISPRCPAAVP